MENVKIKKPPLNTDLEAIRNLVLSEPENVQLCESVAACTKNIHVSYLFLNYYGMEARKAICISLTSIQSQMISDWKELGTKLGLSSQQISAIPNNMYPGANCADMTLLAFAQYPDSTIENVIRTLYKIGRSDAISHAKSFLEDLARDLSECLVPTNYNMDCDYSSHTDVTDTLIRPKGYTQLCEQLPVILKDFRILEQRIKFKTRLVQNEIHQRNACIEQRNIQKQSQNKYSRTVMLTFAADGEDIARKVAVSLRTVNSNSSWPIGVLLLSDHQERVECNAEQFILHFFHKMDFIVPILTEGYFRALYSKDVLNLPSCCIDGRYVPFIHDLMTKYYVKNTCKNKKIRCIIPDAHFSNIVGNPDFCNDPVLQVYEKESRINQLATRILNANV